MLGFLLQCEVYADSGQGHSMKRILILAALLLAPRVCSAELTPEEIAIVAMRESPQSVELARYYMAARGIPEDHIFLLPGKPVEAVGRQEWETTVAPAIRRWLEESQLEDKVRC